MNKHFNLLAFATALPQPSMRRVICNSMLGVLNYNLISSADRVAEQLANEKVDIVALDERDVRALMAAVDDQGDVALKQMGRVKALQREFYELLRVTSARSLTELTTKQRVRSLADAVRRARDPEKDKAPWGSLERAIADSVGVQNAQEVKDIANKRKALASVGLHLTDSRIATETENNRMRSQMFADRRAARVGVITWVIDKMFIEPTGNAWTAFTIEEREFFCEKAQVGLDKVDDRVTTNITRGIESDDALGIADVLFARDTKAKLTAAMNAADVAKPRTPKAKVQVVKKDGSVQKLKDAQARKVTQELLNGMADTPNKVKRTSAFVEKLQAEANGVTTG